MRSRLDNGVQGFIPTKFLSDKVVKHPEERVKVRGSLLFFLCLPNFSDRSDDSLLPISVLLILLLSLAAPV